VSECATSTWRFGAILNPSLALTGSHSALDGNARTPTPPPRPPPPPSSPPPPMDSSSSRSSDQEGKGSHRRLRPPPPATPPPPPSFGHRPGRSATVEASRASHPLTLILQKLANKPGENGYEEDEEVFERKFTVAFRAGLYG